MGASTCRVQALKTVSPLIYQSCICKKPYPYNIDELHAPAPRFLPILFSPFRSHVALHSFQLFVAWRFNGDFLKPHHPLFQRSYVHILRLCHHILISAQMVQHSLLSLPLFPLHLSFKTVRSFTNSDYLELLLEVQLESYLLWTSSSERLMRTSKGSVWS